MYVVVRMMYDEYVSHRRARFGSIPFRGSRDFSLCNSENFEKVCYNYYFDLQVWSFYLCFESKIMILCIWLLTTQLVHFVISFAESRAGSVVVRTLIYSGVMLWLWFTEPLARGPGSTYIWRYAVYGVMLCCDVWRRYGDLKPSGVMLCYGAIDRRATIFPVPYAWFIFWSNILIFWKCIYFLYLYFDLNSDCILHFLLCILSTYFVLTPFLRGLRFMPAGTNAQFGDPPV